MAREVYWHMPGFCVHFYIHQVLIDLMSEYPDKFRDGYKIGSVYGTFPGAIWNGGRAVFGLMDKKQIQTIINTYNKLGAPVRFTWTNSALEEKHVYDTYCNMIMDLADNGQNQVLVNKEVLEKYLREKYPNFKYISSTTKRIVTCEELVKELEKDYFMCVLDYDLNHDEKVLKELAPSADRVEILVDEVCFPHCPKRTEHYYDESIMQLNFEKGKPFPCPNRSTRPSFKESMKRPSFIGNDEIDSYIERGYCNFKLVGRGLPIDFVKESYMYYLVKDEHRDFISRKLDAILAKLNGTR